MKVVYKKNCDQVYNYVLVESSVIGIHVHSLSLSALMDMCHNNIYKDNPHSNTTFREC